MRAHNRPGVPEGITKKCGESHPDWFQCGCAWCLGIPVGWGFGSLRRMGLRKALKIIGKPNPLRTATDLKKAKEVCTQHWQKLAPERIEDQKVLERPLTYWLDLYAKERLPKLSDNGRPAQIAVLRERFGKKTLADVGRMTGALLAALEDEYEESDWEETTWLAYLRGWSAIFTWISGSDDLEGLGWSNPLAANRRKVQDAKSEHPIDRVRKVRISRDLEGKLLFAAGKDSMMRLRIGCALYTGLRRGEMLRVQKRHCSEVTAVDEITGQQVVGIKVFIPATSAKARRQQEVFITQPRVAEKVRERLAKLDADDFVFGAESGRKVERFDWQATFAAAGIADTSRKWDADGKPTGLCWHDLRHEFAYRVFELTGSKYKVQLALRVSSESVVERYCHPDDAVMMQAFNFSGAVDTVAAVG